MKAFMIEAGMVAEIAIFWAIALPVALLVFAAEATWESLGVHSKASA